MCRSIYSNGTSSLTARAGRDGRDDVDGATTSFKGEIKTVRIAPRNSPTDRNVTAVGKSYSGRIRVEVNIWSQPGVWFPRFRELPRSGENSTRSWQWFDALDMDRVAIHVELANYFYLPANERFRF